MTVIVWDGTTLAADRRAGDAWMKCGTVVKIARVNGHLVGCAGVAADAREVVAWYSAGANPALYPAGIRGKENGGAKMLVITPAGVVRIYDNSPFPIEYCEAPHGIGRRMAIGSGREAAMAAMLAGCGARRAVEIATLICDGVGNGIDTLEL